MKARAAVIVLLLLSSLLVATAQARTKEFKDYVVHYNAFTSDELAPEVAQKYGIRRSPSTGVLTVVVMRKETDKKPVAVKAKVKTSAVNLNDQLKRMRMREIIEGDAIYYLADFHVSSKEVLNFDVRIVPENTSQELDVQFRQQFFTQPPQQ